MIHIFIGTKAQLIKMAPVMQELQQNKIEYNFVFSGQHQDTIEEIRQNFNLKAPDICLHKGKDITGIFQMLGWFVKVVIFTLRNRKKVWQGDKNGIVLNHGDTFSTLLGTALAKSSNLKTAHIESGLRSFNIWNPFPEELTRLICFNLSDYFFAPDEWALKNLEAYKGVKINTKANTLYDTLKRSPEVKSKIDIPNEQFGVVSFHRFENIFKEEQLIKIVNIVCKAAKQRKLLLIMHQPTKQRLVKAGLLEQLSSNENIELRPRYDYLDFIQLVKSSQFVITDGGSNQEECYYLGKPCLLLRNYTERKEGLGENVVLSCFNSDKIDGFISNPNIYNREQVQLNYKPSQTIVEQLKEFEQLKT